MTRYPWVLFAAVPFCLGQMCGAPLPENDQGLVESGQMDIPPLAGVGDYQQATWLVISGNSQSLSRATSFAIAPNLLATNAHVTEGVLADMRGQNGFAYAFQNETGMTATITSVWTHPAYVPFSLSPFGPLYSPVTPDIGIMTVDITMPVTVPLAGDESLASLQVLDEVSMCGFPGALGSVDFLGLLTTGQFHPRTSCLHGTISSLRPFDPGQPATVENCDAIQYDMPTSPGTSGSAVFNSIGEVIGVHATGSASGAVSGDYNFAIRSNRLKELLGMIEAGTVAPIDLASVKPVCSTTYFDNTFRFGFTPPAGWGGPYAPSAPSAGVLTHVNFSSPSGPQAGVITVQVLTTTETNPYEYIHSLIDAGATMLSQPYVWTPTNGVAYYFVTQGSTGRRYAECLAFAFGRAYCLTSTILPEDPPELLPLVETAVKSLCIDLP